MGVLRRHALATQDPDEAQQIVSDVFCEHTLTPIGKARREVDMSLTADEMGPVRLVRLNYGVPVRIQPEPLGDFFLVQVPRTGSADITQDGTDVASLPGVASVLSPTASVTMEWHHDTDQLCVYLARSVVEHELRLMLARPMDKPLIFLPQMKLDDETNAAWLRTVLFLADELRRGTSLTHRPEIMQSFGATLAGQLLVSQRHNYSEQLGLSESMKPSRVQQAIDYIEAHLSDADLTVPRVAAATGVSVRTLQEAFRRELEMTPLAYIKERRLTIAHLRLRAGDPTMTTVTRIATGVGVSHFGRFSGEYRRRFGEKPSQTLMAG
ncbi:AraC family transcriptional regulator [Enemella sp. A6]|uniref:AraC family transcriptional regulator n=1 Tax=Enemella sp. A6 TaxID=3440152 RepID=UPI003EBBE804